MLGEKYERRNPSPTEPLPTDRGRHGVAELLAPCTRANVKLHIYKMTSCRLHRTQPTKVGSFFTKLRKFYNDPLTNSYTLARF